MIVTELVTNAFKYAYPVGASGEIQVRLSASGERVAISIEDDGVGWDGIGPVQGSGLGTRIVRAMAANLNSAVEYDTGRTGTRARLSFLL